MPKLTKEAQEIVGSYENILVHQMLSMMTNMILFMEKITEGFVFQNKHQNKIFGGV